MNKRKAEEVFDLIKKRKGEAFSQEMLPLLLFEGERSGEIYRDEARKLFADLYTGDEDFEKVRTDYFMATTAEIPYFRHGAEKVIFVHYESEADVNPYIGAYTWNESGLFNQYGHFEYWDDMTCKPWNLPVPSSGKAYIPLYNVKSLYQNVFREYFVEDEIRKVKIAKGEGLLVKLKDDYRKNLVSYETLSHLTRVDVDFALSLEAKNRPSEKVQAADEKAR